MSQIFPAIDPTGLLEYSVVFTDRSVNHMSALFQGAMRDLNSSFKNTYNADHVAIVPGSGTYAMEAVARQLATGQKVLVVRNGFFSFRWSQILEMGQIAAEILVLKARRTGAGNDPQAPFAPVPAEEVAETIRRERPALVFMPHVETASGMILPDDYIQTVAQAAHEVGGLVVVDCIASGAMWLDMRALGIDILISAPQKGWSGTPCCGIVMLNDAAEARVQATTSTSFACDLKKWRQIMQAYENGGHAYHATMPTDSLLHLRDLVKEAEAVGLGTLKAAQAQLGEAVRAKMREYGYPSVAAEGFAAPGVVVCYTDKTPGQLPPRFAELGLQIAAGVPLQCDEGDNFKTFRIGLFGLDKLQNIPRTVALLEEALQRLSAA